MLQSDALRLLAVSQYCDHQASQQAAEASRQVAGQEAAERLYKGPQSSPMHYNSFYSLVLRVLTPH